MGKKVAVAKAIELKGWHLTKHSPGVSFQWWRTGTLLALKGYAALLRAC
jgi:hypothetical protein